MKTPDGIQSVAGYCATKYKQLQTAIHKDKFGNRLDRTDDEIARDEQLANQSAEDSEQEKSSGEQK